MGMGGYVERMRQKEQYSSATCVTANVFRGVGGGVVPAYQSSFVKAVGGPLPRDGLSGVGVQGARN